MAGWPKDVVPSDPLCGWIAHGPAKWDEFHRRYFAGPDREPQTWQPILDVARQGPVTLLYSARDTEHNNAVTLKECVERFEDQGESR